MARVSLDPPRSLSYRMAAWYSRRRFGEVIDPMRVMGHHPRLIRSYGRFEGQVQRWRRVDERLKQLAEMAAAVAIGCRWCIDFGYWQLHLHGLPAEKIEAIPRWRDSDLFDPLERLVLEYAEAITATPPTVDDELVRRLRQHLDEAQLVELSMMIALENTRSRFNAAMGMTGQGFKERCEVSGRSGGSG